MKRYILILALFASLFLAACGADYYDRVIRNESSKQVSYVYDGKTENLGPNGDSRTYSVTLAVHAPSIREVGVGGHLKSVVMKSDGLDYIFENVPAIPLVVYNTLNEQIKISNEYIDADGSGAGSTEITVGATADNIAEGAVIYTSNPVFSITSTALPGYVFEAEIKIENGTRGVTVR
jgi:hypothetical protein